MRPFLSKRAVRAEPSPGLSADPATPADGWRRRSVWRFRPVPSLSACGLFLAPTIALVTCAILSDLVVAAGTTVSAVLSDWRGGAVHMTVAAILMVVVIGGTIFLTSR